jgi:RNA polymerase sigma factor (sigma-70 family)
MKERSGYSDTSLLEALKNDSTIDDAIRHLYRTQFHLTMAYIKKNNGSDEDAEDIFQEVVLTFIDLVKKDKFRGESTVSTFLYALTRNTWLNELKKRGRTKIRDEKFEKAKDTIGPDVSNYLVNREMKAQLMNVVESLGETCKKILVAVYFDNLAMKEILNLLNYENEQVVRNKKYKCLKQMEQLIAGKPNLAKNLQSIIFYE